MTTDKARKRAVRTRMQKTGERYAAARRHAIHSQDPELDVPTAAAPAPLPPRVAEPTMSDATITKGTGRGWDDWFRTLDAWDATAHTHTEIARWLRDEQAVPGWWAQSVAVGYEYARGMRSRSTGEPGRLDVGVRKTIAADPVVVWTAWTDPAVRDRWLSPGTLTTRPGTGSVGKSARFDDAEGRLVHVYLQASAGRTVTEVTQEGLADLEEVEAYRARWRARLAALAAALDDGPHATTSVAQGAPAAS